MIRLVSIFLILEGLCALPSLSSSSTWHVHQDGSGDATTIQAVIDFATGGDTILVGAGIYLENLRIVGKDIVLKSEQGITATTIDGSGIQETTIYLSGQTRATVIEGFTITGGIGHLRGSTVVGGGAFFDNGSSATIQGNHFTENGTIPTTYYGGATAVNGTIEAPLLRNNTFERNQAKLGGAVIPGIGSEIRDNIFINNACQLDGGAIYTIFNSGVVSIEGNQFLENTAGDHGGAVYVGGQSSSQILIRWNLFIRNQAAGSTRDYLAGGSLFISKVHGTVTNNTIVGTIAPTWSTCGGGALSLRSVPANLDISANIFALNHCSGVTCRYGTENTLGPNLFWMNDCPNLGYYPAACPSQWASGQIYSDPLFCGSAIDDFTVSSNSPALIGPVLMGFNTVPGCGQTGVAVRRSTWGQLKTRFH